MQKKLTQNNQLKTIPERKKGCDNNTAVTFNKNC